MNVVIYARYSSHSQTEQSIEGQIAICQEYAKRNNYTIIGEYIDRALTGTNDNRPQFRKMIEDSNKKIFNGVLVYQLDRFARNRYDSAMYKNKLKKNNVRVFSAKENISDDASGILMESVLEGMAEYYSAELSQKVRRGMKINAEKCLFNGGTVPLGFKIDENKKFQIDESQAKIVRKIFSMYKNGDKTIEIINYLNERNIKTCLGNKFNKNSISKMLKNKRYIGTYTYNDIEIKNGIPQIIDNETFEAVQERMKITKKAPAKEKAKTGYLLTTKLFCGTCNEMMIGVSGTSKTKKLHHYYSCNGKRKHICNRKDIKKELLENRIVEETRNILTNENIERIAQKIFEYTEKAKDNTNVTELEKQLKENEKQKNNLFDSLKICEIDSIRKSIFEEMSKMEEERKRIERNILIEKNSNFDISIAELKAFFLNIRKYSTNNMLHKKLLINSFINKIYIYDDHITIIYTVRDKNNNSITIPSMEEIESSFLKQYGSP